MLLQLIVKALEVVAGGAHLLVEGEKAALPPDPQEIFIVGLVIPLGEVLRDLKVDGIVAVGDGKHRVSFRKSPNRRYGWGSFFCGGSVGF